jgi:hypothetical protein
VTVGSGVLFFMVFYPFGIMNVCIIYLSATFDCQSKLSQGSEGGPEVSPPARERLRDTSRTLRRQYRSRHQSAFSARRHAAQCRMASLHNLFIILGFFFYYSMLSNRNASIVVMSRHLEP